MSGALRIKSSQAEFSRGLVRWLKFNAVGIVGIGVQLATLTALRSGLRWNYLLATAVAVEAAVLHNFFWHQRFTWADRPARKGVGRLIRFNLTVGAISVLGNLIAMKLLVEVAGIEYFLANVFSIAACSMLNFLVADRTIFVAAPRACGTSGTEIPQR